MATRVDFLGPPAVGKSTLCRALLENQQMTGAVWIDAIRAEQEFATPSAFLNEISQMTIPNRLYTFIASTKHSIIKYILRGVPHPFIPSGVLEELKDELLADFATTNSQLVETISQHWFAPDSTLPTLSMRYFELMNWIKKQLFIMRFAGDVHILADNSRLTRGVSEVLSCKCCYIERRERIFDCYCDSVLSPAGILHIEGDSQQVLNQMKMRTSESGSVNIGHLGRTQQQIIEYTDRRNAVNSIAANRFVQKGIPVLTLQSGDETSGKLVKVRQFLSELGGAS